MQQKTHTYVCTDFVAVSVPAAKRGSYVLLYVLIIIWGSKAFHAEGQVQASMEAMCDSETYRSLRPRAKCELITN